MPHNDIQMLLPTYYMDSLVFSDNYHVNLIYQSSQHPSVAAITYQHMARAMHQQ